MTDSQLFTAVREAHHERVSREIPLPAGAGLTQHRQPVRENWLDWYQKGLPPVSSEMHTKRHPDGQTREPDNVALYL